MDLIDYELELPETARGKSVGSAMARILKHSFGASRVRFAKRDGGGLLLTGRVDKAKLESIRGALKMTVAQKKLTGSLVQGQAEIAPAPDSAA